MPNSDQKTRARLAFLESEAREHPRRHRLRLLVVVLLGYAYPFGLLLGCLLVVIAMTAALPFVLHSEQTEAMLLYIFFLLAALFLSAAILRAFFVSPSKPTEHALAANEAPALRAMIEQIRQSLDSPVIHQICIDTRLNASVTQRSKFGLWGSKTNYLIIGLPLMLAMNPDEFRVVLAHELGHLRGRHNRFSAWIYRVGQTWQELAGRNPKQGQSRRWIMDWFARRYGPYLWTTSLAVRRLHEYEADRRGGEVSGSVQAAHVLMILEWADYRLTRSFWPELFREAGTEPLPPPDVLLRMAQFLATDGDSEQLSRWRRRMQRARTPITTAHPCLADRLQSLGCRDLLDTHEPGAAPNLESSAITLLGESRPRLWQIINASWKASIIHRWRQEHAAAKEWKEKSEKTPPDKPRPDNSAGEWESLQSQAMLSPPEQAKELLVDFLSRNPDHAAANFAMGQLLLHEDDDSAAGYFEKAMQSEEFLGLSLHLLLNYYREAGRDDEADPIRQRLAEYERKAAAARKKNSKKGRRR